MAQPSSPWRLCWSVGFWTASAHLAVDLFVAALALVLLVLVVVAVVLVPVILLGLPLLVPALALVRWFVRGQQWRFAAVGVTIAPLRTPASSGALAYGRFVLTDSASWRAVLYLLLFLPIGLLIFVAQVGSASTALALILLPFYYFALPTGTADLGIVEVGSPAPAVLVSVGALILAVVLIPIVTRLLITLDIALARSLLAPPRREELTERVVELTQSRSRVVDAAEQERRRMERDLHDGAQQRLVAMSMTVGRLSSRLRKSGDTEGLALADEAQGEVRQAIAELRDLTRGLHPPVLTDRGLDAALSAVAARSPVPVMVSVDLPERPSLTLESIAYFFVSEALTNIAKHAHATHATVLIRRDGPVLRATVTDDGRGGADLGKGTGLAGLADRAAGVDGALSVSSPPGGPTVLEMELPCAS